MANVIMGQSYARAWFWVQGIALLLLAILGLFAGAVDAFHNLAIHLEGGENAVHWILGIASIAIAWALKDDRTVANLALAFGVVYLLVGVFGFVNPTVGMGGDTIWHVGFTDNILHLVLGVVSLAAGWMSRTEEPRYAGRPTA